MRSASEGQGADVGNVSLLHEASAIAYSAADLTSNTIITRREDSCGTLESEFHPFIALTLFVVDGPNVLSWAIRERDDFGWRQSSAFERALVGKRRVVRVGVDRIDS